MPRCSDRDWVEIDTVFSLDLMHRFERERLTKKARLR